jgi:four helix bundle protein
MFDFEKLQVYQKAKEYNVQVRKEILSIKALDKSAKDQLRRAAMSIMLNIAEGTSRFSNADKRNFYVISRGSVFECVAVNDILESENIISVETKMEFYGKAEEISKMLFAMIKNLETR